MNKVLISVVGPTAIGKTALSIELANHFQTEIISADSRQFYKEMAIGTAVPSIAELNSAPHNFIQDRSISEKFDVGAFEREALNTLDNLFKHHNVVILVGGSGLYVDALTQGLDVFPDIDPNIRSELNQRQKENGLKELQSLLKKLDPTTYNSIDKMNPHRVIRALEVSISSGKPYSAFKNKSKSKRYFKVISVGLNAERSVLYQRINERVDIMIANGLVDEVKSLIPYQHLPALNTVGYKELYKYFAGEWSLEEAIIDIKKNTRRFAKRQITWFKKNTEIFWYDYTTPTSTIINELEQKLN